jgi:tetratricopeptide (TPR) repeat protein
MTAEALAAKGHGARHQGDWLTSLGHWGLFHALYPSRHEGYLFIGDALWRLKHFAAADDILRRGIEKFPGNEHLILNHAWAGMERRDWAEAEKRFRAVLERFPASTTARFGMALALRELRRLEEAEAVLLGGAGAEADPANGQLLAELAASLGKSDVAVARWQALVARQPDKPEFHAGLVNSLRAAGRAAEAEQALATALRLFPENMTMLRAMAEMAEAAGNWPLALRRWESFKTAFDGQPDGYIGAARALSRLGRLDEAEVVMTPAVRLFAQNAEALKIFAEIAHESGRWTEAAARWRAMRMLAPERLEGFLGEVAALRGAGKGSEADALLASLLDQFPLDLEVACEYAQAPQQKRAWSEAIERWRAVVARFPRAARPRAELARCLAGIGAFAAAEAAAAEALSILPGTIDLLQAQAEISTHKGDGALAEARWAALVDQAPEFADGVIGYARQLIMNGDVQKGVDVLDAAAPRFRSALSFNVERAAIISQLRDWPRALSLWMELWPRAGGNSGIRAEIDHCVAQARLDLELAVADAPDAPAPFVIPAELLRDEADETRERERAKALFMRFESLGDDCEFGLVQRRFGAEPFSLFRWMGTAPVELAAAFRAGLAGIGEPEFTELAIEDGIYHTTDTRYFMFGHTFTLETAAPRAKFYAAQCKRLQFLRDKLLRDLTAAEKIFVYGSAALTDELIDELFDAVRGLGPRATLLCVRVANDEHPAGSVRWRREGLLVGGIRGFSQVDIAIDQWLRICAAAAEMTSERSV